MATRISVSPKSVLRVLLLIVVMLSLTSLVGHLFNYYVVVEDFLVKELQESFVRLFSVDGEGNIPTWYSSVTLLFSSALLAVIAVSTKHSGGRYFYHWGALALIFFYLSVDEGVQIHEMAIKPMRLILQASGLLDAGWSGLLYGWGGLLYYAWVIPGAVCTVIFAMAYVRFLMHLPPKTRWLFTMAGALYVGGAIGVESLSGQYAAQYGEERIGYHALTTAEELLEMLGVAVFVYALLEYMRSQLTTVEFHIYSRENLPGLRLRTHRAREQRRLSATGAEAPQGYVEGGVTHVNAGIGGARHDLGDVERGAS